jgi:CubicO group peptidase (beta-lactamase class C family)
MKQSTGRYKLLSNWLLLKRWMLFIAVSTSASFSGFTQTIDQQLDSIAAAHDMIGSAVIFIKHDSVIVEHYTGKADFARNIPVNDSTFFRVASVSKSVTAMAVMMLYEQQLIDIYEDISLYLGYTVRNPNYPTVPLTVKMLLSHQSSILDGTGYNQFLQATQQAPPVPDISGLITSSGNWFTPDCWRSTEPPGTYFTYANINYAILGTIIEKVTGQRFDQYVSQNILIPLNIEGSFNIYDLPDPDRIAVLYRKPAGTWTPQTDNFSGILPPPLNLNGYVPGTNGLLFAPQGGLRITAPELAKIMRLLSNRGAVDGIRLLQDTTVELMRFRHYCYTCGNDGNNMGGFFRGYGLGLHITTNYPGEDVVFPGIEMIGHPGEAYGLLSDMYFDIKGIYGVIFITNGVGAGYQYGNNSVFYRCEEDVFSLIHNTFIQSQSIEQTPTRNNYSGFEIWPNPSSGKEINIVAAEGFQFPSKIEIRNNTGVLVSEGIITKREEAIPLNSLPPGIYLVNVVSANNQSATKTLIIHH